MLLEQMIVGNNYRKISTTIDDLFIRFYPRIYDIRNIFKSNIFYRLILDFLNEFLKALSSRKDD